MPQVTAESCHGKTLVRHFINNDSVVLVFGDQVYTVLTFIQDHDTSYYSNHQELPYADALKHKLVTDAEKAAAAKAKAAKKFIEAQAKELEERLLLTKLIKKYGVPSEEDRDKSKTGL